MNTQLDSFAFEQDLLQEALSEPSVTYDKLAPEQIAYLGEEIQRWGEQSKYYPMISDDGGYICALGDAILFDVDCGVLNFQYRVIPNRLLVITYDNGVGFISERNAFEEDGYMSSGHTRYKILTNHQTNCGWMVSSYERPHRLAGTIVIRRTDREQILTM